MAHLGRSFALTEALLKERRAGVVLCLSERALGQSFRLSPERPSRFDVLRAYSDESPEVLAGPELAASGTGVAVVRAFGCIQQRSEYVECGGWIDGYDALTERFVAAHEAAEVGAVLLVLDGPGGDAAGLEQAVIRMLAVARKSGKPTLAYVDEFCASAHYWLASALAPAAVFLPPSGQVGSIGAMSWHVDYSVANANAGETVTYFSSPAGKVAGNSDEPLSDLARDRRQATVDACGATFSAVVAAARNISVEAVVALNGAMLVGAAAVAAGLADGLATFEESVSLAAARASARALLVAAPTPTSTSTPAAALAAVPTAPKDIMKLSTALHALLPGLAADASEAAVEAAVLPRLGALRDVMAAAGDTNTATLPGTVKALAADAAKVPSLLAASIALAATSEAAERVALLEDAVRTGKLAPADAWAWDATGKIRSVAPDYAPPAGDVGMSLPQLKGFLSRKAVTTPAGAKPASAKESTGAEALQDGLIAGLTAAQLAFCSAHKLDPVKFAELHGANFSAKEA